MHNLAFLRHLAKVNDVGKVKIKFAKSGTWILSLIGKFSSNNCEKSKIFKFNFWSKILAAKFQPQNLHLQNLGGLKGGE